jgi:sugar lactone lactonase YvrE
MSMHRRKRILEAVAVTLLAGVLVPIALERNVGASSVPVVTVIAGEKGIAETNHTCASGSALTSLLSLPSAVATYGSDIYAASSGDSCVVEILPNGSIQPVAGTGTAGFNGNNISAVDAQLNDPQGLAVDSSGDLFIADSGNNQIREVTTSGEIELVAGSPTTSYGYSGDGGPAQGAELYYPLGVAVDSSGDVIIGDTQNERIREVTDGIIRTIAGTGVIGFNGDDQPAVQATLDTPAGVAIGPDGTIYFGDVGNNQVRTINSDGIIETVAGDQQPGMYRSEYTEATETPLYNPYDIALDSSGDLYIADSTNCMIREVTPSGTIQPVIGLPPSESGPPPNTNGQPKCGFNGNGLSGADSRVNRPYGIAISSSGTLIVADTYNQVVRALTIESGSS